MNILVVDDDRVLSDLIAFTLRRERYEVVCAHDGRGARQRCAQSKPDLAVLDVNLPDTDGFSLCQQLRRSADIPVILLTVRNDEEDVLRGFEVGADDYITKPFSPRQLVARARAVLRRAHTKVKPAVRSLNGWRLDPARREITSMAGETVLLSSLENQLLDYLVINSGQVVTFDTIIEHLWGPEGGSASMVRQLVYRLRGKLQSASPHTNQIHTVAGIGYEFRSLPLS